ncbi:restriction endonuclease subunit S [Actimicrobium sp. CCI2.3]|nr:restriction endonuclease subunit S [Actimicrobium sp. CCI2.3]MDY7574158.1 restriction endonuclease subunit S [Actimicrobium sp. CCI2.3]
MMMGTHAEMPVHETFRLKTGMMQELLTKGIGHEQFKSIPRWLVGKIAEIDEIPCSWELMNILSVAKLESGHTPSRHIPKYWNGDIPWVSLHDTKQLGVREIFKTNLYVTQNGLDNSSARLLPAGTIAFSRTASVGHCVIFGKAMATSQDFANFICGPSLSNRYLLHLFKWMQHVWKNLAEGSTHQTIYMPVFKKLEILVPPLSEQILIAAAADKIDDQILVIEPKLLFYKNLKKALMQDLLTGKVRVKITPHESPTQTILRS